MYNKNKSVSLVKGLNEGAKRVFIV